MLNSNLLFITLCSFLIPSPTMASTPSTAPSNLSLDKVLKTLIPNKITLGTYGMQGIASLGPGWVSPNDRHQLTIVLGYSPSDDLTEDIYHLGAKYHFRPIAIRVPIADHDLQWKLFNLGAGLQYSKNKNLFSTLPAHYPNSYYSPTARRLLAIIGTGLKHKRLELFVNFVIDDIGLAAYVHNTDFFIQNYNFFGLEGVGSLEFRVNYDL